MLLTGSSIENSRPHLLPSWMISWTCNRRVVFAQGLATQAEVVFHFVSPPIQLVEDLGGNSLPSGEVGSDFLAHDDLWRVWMYDYFFLCLERLELKMNLFHKMVPRYRHIAVPLEGHEVGFYHKNFGSCLFLANGSTATTLIYQCTLYPPLVYQSNIGCYWIIERVVFIVSDLFSSFFWSSYCSWLVYASSHSFSTHASSSLANHYQPAWFDR